MSALGGVFSLIVYVAAGLLFWRPLLAHMYAVDYVFILVIVITSGGLGLWAHRAFRQYELEPEAADAYRSKSAVRIVNVL